MYISFSTRVLILAILSLFGIVMAITLFIGATKTDIKHLTATSLANIDYKVYLKQNNFYDSNVLPSDMNYIATLIDYIDTDFKYTISSTDNMNYNYTYSIKAIARVYGDSNKSKVLFERTKVLIDDKALNINDTNIVSIEENVKINYDEYNKLISQFKTSYSLTSTSDVTIILQVKATGKNANVKKDVAIDEKAELVIPLTEQTLDVEMTKTPGYTYEVIDDEEKFVIKNKTNLVLSGLFAIFAIISTYRLFKLKKYTGAKVTKYNKALKKILREYDLIIANVDHSIDESKYEVINVASFEELKDVHDNIGNPILFNEIHKNQKSSFVIVKDNFLYKYILKSVDLEKK